MELEIAQILQDAHDFNPRLRMTTDLRPAVEALFAELHAKQIDYVLVGGVALLSYVEGRNTQDIDLIVRPEQLASVDWAATTQDADFGRAQFRGVRVDLLLRTNRLFAHVADHERTTTQFHGHTIPVATRRGLLLLKLYALPSLYRHSQLARAALYETDIRMLLQGSDIADRDLLSVLDPLLPPSDVAELGRILDEQREKRRF
ncbi:MAG TPA: hypothetical protein VGL81_06665 [Polyangiaceae bacterium]